MYTLKVEISKIFNIWGQNIPPDSPLHRTSAASSALILHQSTKQAGATTDVYIDSLLLFLFFSGCRWWLEGLLDLDQVTKQWLKTELCLRKAKSVQKALYTLRQFVECLIDLQGRKTEMNALPSRYTVSKLQLICSRLAKWRNTYNERKSKENSETLSHFKDKLIPR